MRSIITINSFPCIIALLLGVGFAQGQPNTNNPHIGYLYPAGGQCGTTIQVTAGGQNLNGVYQAHITGEGVTAAVIQHVQPLNGKQLRELKRRLTVYRRDRLAALQGKSRPGALARKNEIKTDSININTVELPANHPLLQNLENMSLQELQNVEDAFFNRKKQPNMQIAETVILEVTIDPAAAPGDREIRFETPAGLTNPLCFQVGTLPEVAEQEPNDRALSATPALETPVVLNGQISPGDIDRFRFLALQGQSIVIKAQARKLIPYLADAVPGWFQATLALYDAKGQEVAFADDYHFDPDPVLFVKIPEEGEYELEIHDALYRGREDFVYRITVGELPFITHIYPLGGKSGTAATVSIDGWNLIEKQITLDTRVGGNSIREISLPGEAEILNSVLYAVDTLPEGQEIEPNDLPRKAQRITLPQIINGRISRPGDVDIFRFDGRAGDEVVAEVLARRLKSPLDSLLRLTDSTGHILAWNDNHQDKEAGWLTHQADSWLRFRLPKDGVYQVQLIDSQEQGGDEYGYRLRLGPPHPDFALRVTPSSITVPAGRSIPISVHALRKDGFDGPIEVSLKDAPPGFTLSGARIPGSRDSIRMNLTAPSKRFDPPVALHLEGLARIDNQTIIRPVIPAEDMMQAFIYQHLVPSQELRIAVQGFRRNSLSFSRLESNPVLIPAGGTTEVRVKAAKKGAFQEIRLELNNPPPGVILQEVTPDSGGLTFQLKADGDAAAAGLEDNLIVEAYTETELRRKDGKPSAQKRRQSLGVLAAIPIEIVKP